MLGSVMVALAPLSAPRGVSGSCRTDPAVVPFSVTAAQVLPTAICAAEGSVRLTAVPSTMPDGHA